MDSNIYNLSRQYNGYVANARSIPLIKQYLSPVKTEKEVLAIANEVFNDFFLTLDTQMDIYAKNMNLMGKYTAMKFTLKYLHLELQAYIYFIEKLVRLGVPYQMLKAESFYTKYIGRNSFRAKCWEWAIETRIKAGEPQDLSDIYRTKLAPFF